MVFEQKKFSKLNYKKSSYGNGCIAELTVKENGNNINFFTWKKPNEFNKIVSPKLQKLGLIDMNNSDIDEEMKALDKFYEGSQ